VRIAVLNNLRAGRNRRQVSRLLALLERHPQVRHVETENASALSEALAGLTRDGVDVLVLNGGDGTLQHALTALLSNPRAGTLPWIAPLRGGRTNMTALDLGVRRNPVAALARILEAAAADRLHEHRVERPVLRVETSRDARCQYGMFFGAGMIRRAIALTHRVFPKGRSQGTFGASLVTAALIAKAVAHPTHGILTPDKAQIRIDGYGLSDAEFYLIIATSLRRLFLRLDPFWGSQAQPVRFTAIASRARRLAAAAPGVAWGRPGAGVTPEHGYVSANAARVDLSIDCGYSVDGEDFPAQADEQVRITADRRIQFVGA